MSLLPVFVSGALEDRALLFKFLLVELFVLEEVLLFFIWFDDDCVCEMFDGGGDVAAFARSFVEPSCATGVE